MINESNYDSVYEINSFGYTKQESQYLQKRLEKVLVYVHPRVVEEYKKYDYEYIPTAKNKERYIFERKSKDKPRGV